MKLVTSELAELRRVITPTQPFGPPDAAQITPSTELLRRLYDPSNRIHRQAEENGAPYVIGRKGAGKTALVMAPKLDSNVRILELPSADVYQGVFGAISLLTARNVGMMPEQSARLWRHLVWCALLAELARGPKKRNAAFRTVQEFCSALGDGAVPATPDDALAAYLRRLGVLFRQDDAVGPVGALLNSLSCDGHSIEAAITAGKKLLDGKVRWVVIVDSLEQYSGPVAASEFQEHERIAFEGLFRFVGGDGTMPDRAFDMRFAFPAELWSLLEGVSASYAKDFHSRVIAHWSARELISLVGKRLEVFCELYSPETLKGFRVKRTHMSYDEARTLITKVLPPAVTNKLGGEEDVVAYLLRHTQLLPRHLLTLLNRVWEHHLSSGGRPQDPVSALSVVEGVRVGEREIVSDVLGSYKRVHPEALLCCERIIPNLGTRFSEGTVHRLYNQNGISRDTGLDFRDFMRLMSEIGAFGRVMGRTTSRYCVGEFEYTRAGSLHLAADEEICLHPVFSERFNCSHSSTRLDQLRPDERELVLPIYPYGCDPDDAEDYRDGLTALI